MPRLVVQNEDQSGQIFNLTGERSSVGRVPGNDVQIHHKSISSRHAELVLDGLDYRLRDLDSTNGTKVNGEKVKEIKLRRNDVVRFGNVDLLYESEHAPDVKPLPDRSKGINLAETGFTVLSAQFTNVSPFKKEEQNDKKSYWGLVIGMCLLVAVAGVCFLVYRLLTVAA